MSVSIDKFDQFFLLEIAESANPKAEATSDQDHWCGELTLPASNGWRVCFFYDCGELDYIDHFVTPSGEKLHVWTDGPRCAWTPAMNWRGVGDLDRLRNSETLL